MDRKAVIEKTVTYVKEELSLAEGGARLVACVPGMEAGPADRPNGRSRPFCG